MTSDEHERHLARSALEQWIARKLNAAEVSLSPLRFPKGTGNSAETTFSTLRYNDGHTTVEKDLVIRRQLTDSELFFEADIRLPFNMMKALAQCGSVPSAAAIGVETDVSILGSPFLIMEAVEGRIVDQVPNYNLEGWVFDLPHDQRAKVWLAGIEAMAKLHNLDWRKEFGFLDDARRGQPGLDQLLQATIDWFRWAQAGRDLSVAEAALDYLIAHKPEAPETCVLWGDPTPANTLFDKDLKVAAILDFEMACLGPGEADLAWWLGAEDNFSTLSGIPRLEGLPSVEETISHYEETRQRKVEHMDYYMLLAWFRMNIVGIRFSDRLVQQGRMPAGTDVLTHNAATMLMARFLGMPECPPGEGVALMGRGMAGGHNRT